MKGAELLRRLKRIGAQRGVEVKFEAKRAKGRHGTLYFGGSRTILQDLKKELPVGHFMRCCGTLAFR
jgi:hypothetical protein